MAGTSLLILIDDITLMLDDVAAMSKLAAKKTAGVLGDDLALNAQQVTGIRAERELPRVSAVRCRIAPSGSRNPMPCNRARASALPSANPSPGKAATASSSGA